MKIEMLNENQIRCTLTREDLERRHMRLSELAYGTENARMLFQEMMRFAYTKYGFEADDMPLMIEAIPISSDSIILMITKVDYPEELDTRFSRFSEGEDWDDDDDFDFFDTDDYYDTQELSYKEAPSAKEVIESYDQAAAKDANATITRLFRFPTLSAAMTLAEVLKERYEGENTLYKSADQTLPYYLVMAQGMHTPAEFNKICNIATEYGAQEQLKNSTVSYFEEHYRKIVDGQALQTLAAL